MPEENQTIDLQEILELLEDPMLNKPLLRGQYFKTFSTALDSGIELSHSMIDRLLSVCIQDLENDSNCIVHALKTLLGILRRIKMEDFPPSPNLLSSILAVFKIVKTSALMSKMENMQKICFEILDLYSDETLLEVTLHSSEITEVLNMYGHIRIPLDVRILPMPLVLRLLKILPKEKKSVFVKENLPIWFSKVIPTCVLYLSNLAASSMESPNCTALETLECLTDELVPINYSENAEWVEMLESIYNPSKYPAMLRAMLNNNSNNWHRLWIVFVRLLKDQITKTTFSSASPINSMLPVVEVAFKMDVPNRCRAFQCWNVLIDNFRMETNLAYIVKRMKLLIIPLKSNNAKVEETAIAKLNTWWHLIISYQTKLDKFVDKVLISFLQFCFGSPSPSFVPGLISENTKKLAVEAFVELGGHLCCSGCGDMTKLTKKIVSKSILVDHWGNWVYSLKKAISILNEDIGVTIQQIQCLWKSFVVTVAELPDNNIRKDLFNELLAVLESLEKQSESNNNVADVVVQLACSLFDDDRIGVLFKPENEDGPIYKIIMLLILNPSLNIYYKRRETVDIVTKFKPLAKYILKTRDLISWIVRCPSLHNVSYLHTAIAEIVCESQYEDIGQFSDFILWPLKPKNVFTDVEYSTKAWVTLMNYVYPKLKPNIQEKLITIMKCDASKTNMHLKLRLCMSFLKYHLENDSVPGCKKHIELLMFLTSGGEEYQYVRDNLALLTDTIVILTSKTKMMNQSDILKYTLTIIKNLIQFIRPILDETEDFDSNKQLYENLLKNVEMLLHGVKSPLTMIVIEELLNFKTVFLQHSSLQPTVLNIMNIYASNSQSSDSHILSRVKATIDNLEQNTVDNDCQIINENTFAAPDIKAVVKKVKKKETTIVNTVTENGEEFEVIKSNWKFNPRKLTENQKEKLQRKREDIPALYQDLSQSQDDFKLTTWKTDSQDTSSTSSKSTTNSKTAGTGNVSEILKKIPSSDVVPKIIENISEKKNSDISLNEKTANESNEVKPSNNSTSKLKRVNTKDPKSPRMALKDRVFRNVRNLIEKSSVQKDNKDLSESLIQVENVPKTPTSKIIENNHLVNSAPPNLGAERPSRLKRKPKKFDDVQIFSLKKSRRSSSLNDSQSDSQESHLSIENPADEKSSIIKPIDGANEKQLHSEIKYKKENPTISTVTAKTTGTENADAKSVNIENEMVKITTVNSEPLLDVISNKSLLSIESSQTLPSNSEVVKSTSDPIKNEVDELKQINELKQIKPSALEDKDMGIECTPEEILSTTSVNDSSNIDVSVAKDLVDGKSDDNVNTSKNIKTPKQTKLVLTVEPRSGRRNSARKSRIEKELAIDMVEGHPFLKIQTEKRITRKNLNSPINSSRRKSLTDKLNKTKVDFKTTPKPQSSGLKKKDKDASSGEKSDVSVVVGESQEKCSENSDELPFSEDVIESSQDSTFSTLSVKSSKPPVKKLVVVAQKIPSDPSEMRGLLSEESINKVININNTDDADLPQNKTSANDNTDINSTENMDTQPVDNKAIEEDQSSSDVIIINDDEEPIIVSSETQEIAEADTQPTNRSSETQEIANADTQPTNCSSETQEIANADTQPTDSSDFREQKSKRSKPIIKIAEDDEVQISNIMVDNTEDEVTKTIDVSMEAIDENTASSPFKDQEQRKKDFLDNTLEISPIKSMSPVRDKKSPSPETSSDYVLIKLTSPVQSNGEPFDKCDSPEIFTEEKVSPDKRDLSPPREENVVNNTSPSSSLSLKKNRPQVRSGGRAAQMLGLCVPDRLQTIMNSERSENDEPKKSSPSNTPARRNLRILYSSVGGDGNDNSEENEDSENFLRFKKTLPTSDCSPSGPILKRKLAEIADDATVSPASKRKRVSFHDPPVSTTIAVQKYIEPSGIRSPQNSALKRQERQNLRSQAILKSPKRLDSVFKLDTVLTKAVESFTESDPTSTDITQSMSLDETPALEIVRNSDLNDVDPICPDLTDCTDPIDNIAADLSSTTMKDMLLKELEGKITTIGDLARMTELEVNRLCIKAPKVKVARKVLTEYSTNKNVLKEAEMHDVVEILADEKPVSEDKSVDKMDVEVQTHLMATNDVYVQTNFVSTTVGCVQTDDKIVVHTSAQTNESGAKSTKEVITSCLAERPDFVENICEHLEESSKLRIAKTLSENSITDIFMKNVTSANSKALISRILQKQNKANSSKKQSANDLLFLQDYLCDKFDNRDLILFCSQLLAKVHSKTS